MTATYHEQFAVRTRQLDGVLLAQLFGEFDLASREEFENSLASLGCLGVRQMVVDLRGLTFIDSTGLGSLFRVWGWSKERDIPAAFIAPQGTVGKTLALAGADDILPMTGEASRKVAGIRDQIG